MGPPTSYDYTHYLESKSTIDERALHPRVWSRFTEELFMGRASARVLEAGGGTGSMCQRVIDAAKSAGVKSLHYVLVDMRADNVEAARRNVGTWARGEGFDVFGTDQRMVLADQALDVELRLIEADIFEFCDSNQKTSHNAVIAQALIDLFSAKESIGQISRVVASGALWYLPINFDGVTAFVPEVSASFDAKVERLFHESMRHADANNRSGSHSGRKVLEAFSAGGYQLVDVAGSDWVVRPTPDGTYPGDEDYFLYYILNLIDKELHDHDQLDTDKFQSWLQKRRDQVADGELIYLTHQLDVLARSD